MHTPNQHSSGFSLIEMVIYVSLLAVILLVVIGTMFSFTGSYKEIGALRSADHAGIDAMERMTREIRAASSVDTINSVLGTTPGTLTLVVGATTTKFYLQNNTVHMNINSAYYGPLTGSSTSVTALTFNMLSTTTSSAVKIDMTVEGQFGGATTTKQFHSTVVLKGT